MRQLTASDFQYLEAADVPAYVYLADGQVAGQSARTTGLDYDEVPRDEIDRILI